MLYSIPNHDNTEIPGVMCDSDGSIAVASLTQSATSALIHRLIDDEVLLAGLIGAAYIGWPGEGPPSSLADVAVRLRNFLEYVWGAAVELGDPDYLAWARPFSRHAEIDWEVVAVFVQHASVVFTPDEEMSIVGRIGLDRQAELAPPIAGSGR